jgi:dUTP pyrophosphatase
MVRTVKLSEALSDLPISVVRWDLPMPIVRYTHLPHAKGLRAPSYYSDWAAGFDLQAAIPDDETWYVSRGQRLLVPTGLILAIPKGYEGQVRPRSGLAVKHGITVLNAPGTIDADYRGEIKVILINHGETTFSLKRSDRIAQLVIAPVTTVTLQAAPNLDETERGEGGFGSTG